MPKIEPAFNTTRLFLSRGDSAFIFMLLFLASKIVGVEKLSYLFISWKIYEFFLNELDLNGPN